MLDGERVGWSHGIDGPNDKVHPDMQSVVVHIPFHILDPAGMIDEFFETRSALHDVVDS